MPLTDYFIAADDDAARAAVTLGPIPAEFVTVEAKNLDPVVALGTLTAILTGRDYDEVTGHPRHGHAITDTGPSAESFVLTVPDGLRDALAAADDHLPAGGAGRLHQGTGRPGPRRPVERAAPLLLVGALVGALTLEHHPDGAP